MRTTESAPCPTWFADNEWNVGLWGAFAFAGDDDDDDRLIVRGGADSDDRGDGRDFIDDHAWGGGLDAKYFFARYFGLGISGFGLFNNDESHDFDNRDVRRLRRAGFDITEDDEDDDGMGAVLATFTLRYPIECARFAPYAYVGGGVAFGGGNDDQDRFRALGQGTFERIRSDDDDDDAAAIGQVGLGVEARFTQHIGWITDVSWNITEDDNWGMVRTGINFAF